MSLLPDFLIGSSMLTEYREKSRTSEFWLNEEGAIRDCSKTAEEMFGQSREQLISRHISQFFPQLRGIRFVIKGKFNSQLRLFSQLGTIFKFDSYEVSSSQCRLFWSLVGQDNARLIHLIMLPLEPLNRG